MKKDSSKLGIQQFVNQQLSASQTSQIKGGNGNSTDGQNSADIVIVDVILI
jgi:hypothetical protein